MPDPARFWDKLADKYSNQAVKDMENYNKTLDCTRKHLSARDEVLEVGCGTGTTALLLAPSVKQITASDISSRMIEIAKDKAVAQKVDNVDQVMVMWCSDVLARWSCGRSCRNAPRGVVPGRAVGVVEGATSSHLSHGYLQPHHEQGSPQATSCLPEARARRVGRGLAVTSNFRALSRSMRVRAFLQRLASNVHCWRPCHRFMAVSLQEMDPCEGGPTGKEPTAAKPTRAEGAP